MASLLNSIKDASSGGLLGRWEDVKDYTSSIITLQSPTDGSGYVQWANTARGQYPQDSDIIASERLLYTALSNNQTAITRQWDHRGRWFRVLYDSSAVTDNTVYNDFSLNIQTLYKKAPTELKIADDSGNVVSVNAGLYGNSLYTVLTDSCGKLIRTTNPSQTTGEALYVHLADGSGTSLATTTNVTGAKSLYVALRDASNRDIDTTGGAQNSLYVRPSDSAGNAQASTLAVTDAYTAGVALYGALADNSGYKITTTKTAGLSANNALYVHLADSTGTSISVSNPLPVVSIISTQGSKSFDICSGVVETFKSLGDLSSNGIRLYNLFAYNDSPVTAWLKVYDVSTGELSQRGLLGSFTNQTTFTASMALLGAVQKLNVTIPAGRTRDLVFPGGSTFNKGVYFRASPRATDSIESPGLDTIFVNGSYSISGV